MTDFETKFRRVQRANKITSVVVPAWILGVASFEAARHAWAWMAYNLALFVGLVGFLAWLDRRTKRRIAERQRLIDELMRRHGQ